jgi:mono/diheme cytochrome c family protein
MEPDKTQRCRKFDQQCRHDRASGGVMSAIAYLSAFSAMLGMVTFGLAADARAQENLDRDKSGAKLFAASCVQCHKSARGLAKGRISFTLSYYLRQHYTSSSASADTLTAYLQSVDTPPAKAKGGAKKSQVSKAQPKDAAKGPTTSAATSAPTSRLPTGTISEDPRVRPPAKIPGR